MKDQDIERRELDVSFSVGMIRTVILIIAIFLLLGGVAQAGDWPMFRHDLTHSGASNEILNPPLEIKWKFQTGEGIISSPAISNGLVYVGSLDGYIYAINSNKGELKWKFQTDNDISSSPAISNNLVYIGSGHYLYAIDAATGSLKWKYQTSGEILSSPVVNEKTVYMGTYDGMIYALNAENSELKWKFQVPRHIISSPAISNGILYIGSIDGYDGYIYSIDAELGYLIWKTATGHITSSPLAFGDLVYLSDLRGSVYALDISTGETKWEYKKGDRVFTSPMSSSPAISDGILYIGSTNNNVYAFNAKTGALKWIYTSDVSRTSRYRSFISSPAALKNIIYVGSDDKYLYALDALTGTLKWRYQTSGKVISSPSVSNGNLYVGSEDGHLYAFSSSNITEETQILEIPRLISPLNGANMSNWHKSGSVWDFDWSDVEDASEYQLYVKNDLSEYPIIDTISTNSFHQYVHTGTVSSRNYGWTWKVRAKINSQWSEWSEIRNFQVEEVNTDPPASSSIPATPPPINASVVTPFSIQPTQLLQHELTKERGVTVFGKNLGWAFFCHLYSVNSFNAIFR